MKIGAAIIGALLVLVVWAAAYVWFAIFYIPYFYNGDRPFELYQNIIRYLVMLGGPPVTIFVSYLSGRTVFRLYDKPLIGKISLSYLSNIFIVLFFVMDGYFAVTTGSFGAAIIAALFAAFVAVALPLHVLGYYAGPTISRLGYLALTGTTPAPDTPHKN